MHIRHEMVTQKHALWRQETGKLVSDAITTLPSENWISWCGNNRYFLCVHILKTADT